MKQMVKRWDFSRSKRVIKGEIFKKEMGDLRGWDEVEWTVARKERYEG